MRPAFELGALPGVWQDRFLTGVVGSMIFLTKIAAVGAMAT
jgi:hypothetical protein